MYLSSLRCDDLSWLPIWLLAQVSQLGCFPKQFQFDSILAANNCKPSDRSFVGFMTVKSSPTTCTSFPFSSARAFVNSVQEPQSSWSKGSSRRPSHSFLLLRNFLSLIQKTPIIAFHSFLIALPTGNQWRDLLKNSQKLESSSGLKFESNLRFFGAMPMSVRRWQLCAL